MKTCPASFSSEHVHAKSLQSCPILCDPMDCSPPDSSVHGVLQARILEWVAMPFSRESSQPRGQTSLLRLLYWQAGSLSLAPPGSPWIQNVSFLLSTWTPCRGCWRPAVASAHDLTLVEVNGKGQCSWHFQISIVGSTFCVCVEGN